MKRTICYMNYGDGVFKTSEDVEADNSWDDVIYTIDVDEEKFEECETLDDLYYTVKGAIGPDYDIYCSENLSSLDLENTVNEGYFVFNLRNNDKILIDFIALNNEELRAVDFKDKSFEDVKVKYTGIFFK